MNNSTVENGTKLVGEMMAKQINADLEILGSKNLTPDWFNKMMDVIIESFNISFENATAANFFKRCVIKVMDRKAYEVVFTPVGMDENGNYTKDQSKWA